HGRSAGRAAQSQQRTRRALVAGARLQADASRLYQRHASRIALIRIRKPPCGPKPKNSPMPSASHSPCCGGLFDFASAPARVAELNKRAEDPTLWSDPQAAQKLMRQRQALERAIAGYRRLERELDDAVTLIELGEAEDDAASVAEGEAGLKKLAEEARRQEV